LKVKFPAPPFSMPLATMPDWISTTTVLIDDFSKARWARRDVTRVCPPPVQRALFREKVLLKGPLGGFARASRHSSRRNARVQHHFTSRR
jgi:hypothetical protein